MEINIEGSKMKTISRKAIVLIFIMLAVFLSGCGQQSDSIKKPQPASDAVIYDLKGDISLKVSGDKAVVSGTTDLMDGCVVKISLVSASGEELASEKKKIESGEFSSEFAIPDDYKGRVFGFLSCTYSGNGSQPKEVKEAYGKKFVNLDGENVIWNASECMYVLQSNPVEIG